MNLLRSPNRLFRSGPLVIGLVIGALPCCVYAGVLQGSGNHLPLSSPIQVSAPGQAPTLSNIVHPTSFDGTWSSPVLPAWVGTFHASGPVTDNQNLGFTTFNFTTLPMGRLPIGTLMVFGDVDAGSMGGEKIILDAWGGGFPLNLPWLDEPSYVWGNGRNGGDPSVLDMPSWDFDPTTGRYIIDGDSVTGFNPTISFALRTNSLIDKIRIQKMSTFNAVGFLAPVPGPGATALGLTAGLLAISRRRDR
ncbi:MAG: hypothetical protein IT435_05815 [Phycisphaerales bacterium]|nr:hypothetical protein [Phycisphaerales bacterium]